jgi:uncharacterized protein
MTACAVLVPGYRGTTRQPILVAIAERLAAHGVAAHPVTISSTPRPSIRYRTELAALRSARDAAIAEHGRPVALVGRSFGGRMCALLAAEETPDALVIVGHPIAPPGRPRPRDEAALAAVRCPTLVVQGDRDELGPLPVLQRIAAGNPLIDIVVIADAGHELGAKEPEAAEHVARWLEATLR